MPRNILNLPAYTVLRVEETEHDYHVYAEATAPPAVCPHCASTALVGFGRREQLVKDLPAHGKRVGIYVDTRRFRCRTCSKTFFETLPAVDERRAMTSRLADWIGRQSLRRTFSSVADEVGVTEGAIRHVFHAYVERLEQQTKFETPRWLGIDEIHLIKPRGVVTNIEVNTVVEILPDRNKRTVLNYLTRLSDRERIRYVTMDMWNPYREAVEAMLPQATVVIDKFHVVRMANDALESIRKAQRAKLSDRQRRGLMHDRFVLLKRRADLTDEEYLKLSGWTANHPALGAAYDAKEAFYGIWDMETRPEAERAYEIWRSGLTDDMREAFHPLIRAVDNWHPHIFAYFDHRVTNAYTESLNNLIRVMNRMGRGYSFEALRAKILFTEGVQKTRRPAFERRARDTTMERGVMGRMCHGFMVAEPDINLGADISTLTRLIEAGTL